MAMTGMGPGGGMDELASCCAAIKSNSDGLGSMIGEIYQGNIEDECLCSLGEVLLFGYRENLLPTIAGLSDTCAGKDPNAPGQASPTVTGGLALLLNSKFGPTCPNIAAQLNNGSSADAGIESSNTPEAAENGEESGEKDAVDSSSATAQSSSSIAILSKIFILLIVIPNI